MEDLETSPEPDVDQPPRSGTILSSSARFFPEARTVLEARSEEPPQPIGG